MEVTRPVVKRSGRGGSVEADSGKFYTFNYVVQRIAGHCTVSYATYLELCNSFLPTTIKTLYVTITYVKTILALVMCDIFTLSIIDPFYLDSPVSYQHYDHFDSPHLPSAFVEVGSDTRS